MTTSKPKRYLTVRQLRDRWGGCSHMLIERRLKSDPDFPKPTKIGGHGIRLFDEAEVEAYERRAVTRRDVA